VVCLQWLKITKLIGTKAHERMDEQLPELFAAMADQPLSQLPHQIVAWEQIEREKMDCESDRKYFKASYASHHFSIVVVVQSTNSFPCLSLFYHL
jgi:hypothetical protein